MGAEKAISAVVDKFYEIMMADVSVSAFFSNTDMSKQVSRMKQFITLVTGGPNNYEGADMKTLMLSLIFLKKNSIRHGTTSIQP